MNQLYLGALSGTSMDGIDTILVEFHKNALSIVDYHYQPLPHALRQQLKTLCSPSKNELDQFAITSKKMGDLFSGSVLKLLNKCGIEARCVSAIGFHGQTIRHAPHASFPYSLQIGDPNVVTAKTQITTITDFRGKDLAYQGQGAPITPIFHQQFFGDKNHSRIILNIGGIANLTYLQGKSLKAGYDTGPGNVLMDTWIQQRQKKKFDDQGEWAKQGAIYYPLLEQLLSDQYFKKEYPKSTGTDYFNLDWLQSYLIHFGNDISPQDIQCTLAELTARSVSDAIHRTSQDNDEIIVCGGGAHNHYLLTRLQKAMPTKRLMMSDELGIPIDWVEAVAFAWFAKQTLERKKIDLTQVTGASQPSVMGGIYYP